MNVYENMDSKYAYDGALGALYTRDKTEFRVWSPNADSVTLNLYRDSVCAKPYSTVKLERTGGVWSAEVSGDLHGVYYTYSVDFNGESAETIDIYTQSAGANGKRGMVVDMERVNPEGWEKSEYVTLENPVDAVLYELHVRDFSIDGSGGFRNRGKFLAFTEKDVKNAFGDEIGLDYIKNLGVTHIHLLPAFDYGSVDESSNAPQFNWGYDPVNYNLPEGSYSTDAADGLTRVREFKEMVKAAHERGIGIVMDVVYNHTYEAEGSPFDLTVPGYYYRHNEDGTLSDGSACGNEFASERAMARKFICDSLCMWARDYKVDGFRFDLMGLLDIETMNLCIEKIREINPNAIFYGEGWTGGDCPLEESLRAMKKNAREMPGMAMFSDDFRDGLKGSVFIDEDRGYVNGGADSESAELMKSLMCGGISHPDSERESEEIWTDSPLQTVNYVEAHDNLTLFDKLHVSCPDADEGTIIAMDKLAAALIFTAQGIPFIQAGQEMLRSKPIHGGGYDENSYKSPDAVNSIKWNKVTENAEVVDYYRGLIAIRKKFPQLRLRSADEIRKRVSFEDIADGAFVMRADDLFVLINPTDKNISFALTGKYRVYADDKRACDEELYRLEDILTAKPLSVIIAQLITEK